MNDPINIEWLRIITVAMAVVAIVQLVLFFRRTREYGVLAPIFWMLMIIAMSVFKFIVDGDPRYYNLSLILNNLIYIYGIGLLIIGGFLFRDVKSWTHRR